MNEINEDLNNQQTEFTLPKDIEKYAYPWEIWFLKLDRYIDPNLFDKKKKLGFRWGIISALVLFLLAKILHFVTGIDLVGVLVFITAINITLSNIESGIWFQLRCTEQKLKKQKLDYGCNRAAIPGYNQQFWISRRLLAHYMCTISVIWGSIALAWVAVICPLALVNWLIFR